MQTHCVRERVPFFFKQWGGRTPKAGGRTLDGIEYNGLPPYPLLVGQGKKVTPGFAMMNSETGRYERSREVS